jgi:hypothetical protein
MVEPVEIMDLEDPGTMIGYIDPVVSGYFLCPRIRSISGMKRLKSTGINNSGNVMLTVLHPEDAFSNR